MLAQYQDCRDERNDWESEWRDISDFLIPGRGVYNVYSRPRKRKLTSPKVVNTIGEDALGVLTSGMHGGLTSPSRPWFSLEWADFKIRKIEPIVQWLQECNDLLLTGFQSSNFYSIINSFYTEYAGFGTGSVYMGEDTDSDFVPFRFELLTAGEYAFDVDFKGKPDKYFRTIYKSARNIVERYGDAAPEDMRRAVEENSAGIDKVDQVLVECVFKEPYKNEFGEDMPYTRVTYIVSSTGRGGAVLGLKEDELEVTGFHEFPYPTARWSVIGSDVYGVGPGSRALPDIKRLQEVEKGFLMAVHKTLEPPINAPAKMKNKINTLPGGRNYYSNPSEMVKELYNVRFDFQGVGAATERIEQRIQRNFFNDIFLTGTRDPNASPLRTGQVQVQEQEKMLRMGPIIERLQNEFLQPIVERGFNIMLRKGLFPPLDPQFAEMVGDYNIHLVSPLATAQRAVALQGINSFLGFIGQAAQFDQQIMDNVDIDEAAREYGDITGVRLGILRKQEDVDNIRRQRQKQMRAQQQKEEQAAMMQGAGQLNADRANARKAEAEAGVAMLEGQQMAENMGMI